MLKAALAAIPRAEVKRPACRPAGVWKNALPTTGARSSTKGERQSSALWEMRRMANERKRGHVNETRPRSLVIYVDCNGLRDISLNPANEAFVAMIRLNYAQYKTPAIVLNRSTSTRLAESARMHFGGGIVIW